MIEVNKRAGVIFCGVAKFAFPYCTKVVMLVNFIVMHSNQIA